MGSMSFKSKESLLPPLWVISLLLIACVAWLAMQLKELVVLLVLGYFVAYAIEPLLTRLEARGVSRRSGFALVVGSFVVLIAVLVLTALPTLWREFYKLSENLSSYILLGQERLGPYLERAREYLPDALRESSSLNEALSAGLPALLSNVSGDTVKRVASGITTTLLHGYSQVLTLVNIALLPFIVYYLAVDLPKLHACVLNLVPIMRRGRVAAVFAEIDGYVSAFVRGQFLVCTALFVLYAFGLWVVGVDLWLLLAAITGFGNLIPYLGFAVGIVLSSLMALVTFGDLMHVVYVWLVFVVVQGIEGTLVTPRILGNSVGLSPLVIIVALFAGGQLCGLLGIFLAVPAAATVRVLARNGYQLIMER
jgi:predicted PurR-regulated permease PerM